MVGTALSGFYNECARQCFLTAAHASAEPQDAGMVDFTRRWLFRGGGLLALAAGLLSPARGAADEPLPAAVEFNRDIRPLLSDKCFQCHGPDKAKRKADLRLDTKEGGAFADRGGYRDLVPGSLAKSELVRRIT